MSIIKRSKRLEDFWFGLIFNIPLKEIQHALWERQANALQPLMTNIGSKSKNGVYIWSPSDTEATKKVIAFLPELEETIKHQSSIDDAFLVSQTLKSLEWKAVPCITTTVTGLSAPLLRQPLCVVKGVFRESPNRLFLPCAGKSANYHEQFKEWAHYCNDVPLAGYIVEGYVVDNPELMNEFFLGKKLSVVTGVSKMGMYICSRDDLKEYLYGFLAGELGIKKRGYEIEIRIVSSGESVIL